MLGRVAISLPPMCSLEDVNKLYLPPEEYHPDKVETVAVPAKAGDVIFFSYCTIHWSNVN